jgi:hypothetical protein
MRLVRTTRCSGPAPVPAAYPTLALGTMTFTCRARDRAGGSKRHVGRSRGRYGRHVRVTRPPPRRQGLNIHSDTAVKTFMPASGQSEVLLVRTWPRAPPRPAGDISTDSISLDHKNEPGNLIDRLRATTAHRTWSSLGLEASLSAEWRSRLHRTLLYLHMLGLPHPGRRDFLRVALMTSCAAGKDASHRPLGLRPP